jgi:benzodiazapine receptor
MTRIVGSAYAKLAISIVLSLLAGVIGSVFTSRSVGTWYVTLQKPSFTPPSGVFGPVWTTLYVLMGISLFLVWRVGTANPDVRLGLVLFAIQLVLNALWSFAFFGMRSPLAGAVVIAVLWAAILANLVVFARVSRLAGALLVPYIVWVSFAAVLNFTIYSLNR